MPKPHLLETLLFCIYLFLFTWLAGQSRFLRSSGIAPSGIAMLFLINVIAGVIYGWIGIYEATTVQMNDTWNFHYQSLKESRLLLTDPKKFFIEIFENPYGDGDLFTSNNSYWNNLKGNAFLKLLSIFNCFSLGNYYINVIFYCFITFFGTVAVYKILKLYISASEELLIISCFLVPSFLYWCNGLHKDGLSFLAIGLAAYCIQQVFIFKNVTVKGITGIVTGLFILFVFKNHVLATMLPALIAWVLAEKFPVKKIHVFLIVYLVCGVAFFTLKYVSPSLDFAAIVVDKQESFISLKGGKTSIHVEKVEPSFSGFAKAFPQAVSLSMFRPYPKDVYKPLILPAFIELALIWLLIILSLVLKRKGATVSSFQLFAIFFSISLLLMVGYTMNNLGATARYRSIIFPLIMPFIICSINWEKIFGIFILKKINT